MFDVNQYNRYILNTSLYDMLYLAVFYIYIDDVAIFDP